MPRSAPASRPARRACARARREFLAHDAADESREPLHGLERDVAGETIGDHDVHVAREDDVALDETAVIDRRAGQAPVRLANASVPLMSSSPMLSSPTRGRSTPCRSAAITEPITANCTRWSAVQSGLAPRSSITVWPCAAGTAETMAGRSMPGTMPSTKRAVASSAPVLPAEMQAAASPRLTRLMATRIEESFLRRTASCGRSSMPTTSLASTSVQRAGIRAREQRAHDVAAADDEQPQVGSATRGRRARRAPRLRHRGRRSWRPRRW